jgi:histidyl-tRNA synthetase
MASRIIQRVKGTRDFYPEDWAYQKWLSGNFTTLGKAFGYQEYEGPTLEHMELYLGKSSEEIVTQQSFSLNDRDGKLLNLRPELTPTLARMVAQKEGELVFPIRWQSYGRFYRYEKPQRGRGRSFYQWNVDLLGSESSSADAEIIAIACNLLKELRLSPEQAVIKVNDRRGLEAYLLDKLAISQDAVRPLFGLIDHVDKMAPEKFSEELSRIGLADGQKKGLDELLKAKDPSFSPWLEQIFTHLEVSGVADYVELDLSIVRGFDYYTSTVFEAWAKSSSLRRALFGGGRYDNLTVQVGGKKEIPGVGFAAGEMALTELLKELDLIPEVCANCAEILVTVFSEDLEPDSASLALALRNSGLRVELNLNPSQRLDRQLKYADRKGIPYVAILGPDDLANTSVVVKSMIDGTQSTLPAGDLEQIKSHIRRSATD